MSRRKIDGTIVCRSRDLFGEITVADDGEIRSLYFGEGILQSSIRPEHPSDLLLEYSQAMVTPLVLRRRPESVLLIGLGGGALVHFFLDRCPGCSVEVAEIRAEVIRLAHEYFQVPRQNARLAVFQADGAEIVRQRANSGSRYDLILLDAFDDGGPASALMEEEFLKACRGLLTPDGICAVNLWTRPKDGFPALHDMFRKAFDGNILKLGLDEDYQNALVFGFGKTSFSGNLASYRAEARRLQRKWGVNFPKFLMRLQWEHFG